MVVSILAGVPVPSMATTSAGVSSETTPSTIESSRLNNAAVWTETRPAMLRQMTTSSPALAEASRLFTMLAGTLGLGTTVQ